MLLIVLAAVVMGGGVLLVGAMGVGAYLLLATYEPANRPADPAAATTGPPAPPLVATAPPPAPAAVEPVPQPAKAPAAVTWVAYEDPASGFQAAFPGGQPQPIDPLAQIEDQEQRDLAAAMMKEWTVLGVTHAGRKYTLTAAPLNLSGIPPEVYLDRMSAGLGAIHQGFSLDPQPPTDKSVPIRDYALKKGDAGKLLRVVAANGHVYQLLIEGEAGLAFSDPAAGEFFERFVCAGVAGVPVASGAPPGGKAASEEAPAEEPDGIDWRPLQGQKIAFTIKFPGVTPQEEDPFAVFSWQPDPEQTRQYYLSQWEPRRIVVESYSAPVGERTYGVTAFRDPNVREDGSIRFNSEMDSLTLFYSQSMFRKAQSCGGRWKKPAGDWENVTTGCLITYGESKVIIRRARLGNYAFVVRVEGPKTMEDADPQIRKFLDSLQPPPDAAPVPLHVKPLPGPGGKTKTKTKQK